MTSADILRGLVIGVLWVAALYWIVADAKARALVRVNRVRAQSGLPPFATYEEHVAYQRAFWTGGTR